MVRVSALLVGSLVAGLLMAPGAQAAEPEAADVRWAVYCVHVDRPNGAGTTKVCAPLPIASS